MRAVEASPALLDGVELLVGHRELGFTTTTTPVSVGGWSIAKIVCRQVVETPRSSTFRRASLNCVEAVEQLQAAGANRQRGTVVSVAGERPCRAVRGNPSGRGGRGATLPIEKSPSIVPLLDVAVAQTICDGTAPSRRRDSGSEMAIDLRNDRIPRIGSHRAPAERLCATATDERSALRATCGVEGRRSGGAGRPHRMEASPLPKIGSDLVLREQCRPASPWGHSRRDPPREVRAGMMG